MKIRKLDDYRYKEKTEEVVHIIKAQQRDDYNAKNPNHKIYYTVISNKNKEKTITNRNNIFWISFKKISKLKAKLLW